jgi:hypothetical protein
MFRLEAPHHIPARATALVIKLVMTGLSSMALLTQMTVQAIQIHLLRGAKNMQKRIQMILAMTNDLFFLAICKTII